VYYGRGGCRSTDASVAALRYTAGARSLGDPLRAAVTIGLFIALAAAPASAWAAPPEDARPPIEGAVGAGIATALVPLVIGSVVLAQNDALDRPQGPFYLIDAGLALAPLVAHGIVGEWKRGLVFSAASSAAALGTTLMLEYNPDLIQHGEAATRVPFGVMFSLAIFTSGVGIADTFFAADRAASASTRARTHIYPMAGRGTAGLVWGGTF
jgi:hypothetical protein